MLEYFLTLLGLSNSIGQRAEDRKQRALTMLAGIDTAIIEAAMTLDFEIARLRVIAMSASIDSDIAVSALVEMRAQCNQLQEIAKTNRASVNAKGGDVAALGALEQWAGTCSVLPKQAVLTVQHIEATIARIALQ